MQHWALYWALVLFVVVHPSASSTKSRRSLFASNLFKGERGLEQFQKDSTNDGERGSEVGGAREKSEGAKGLFGGSSPQWPTGAPPGQFGPPSNYGQPSNYGLPSNYGPPINYGPPSGFGHPVAYGPSSGFVSSSNYGPQISSPGSSGLPGTFGFNPNGGQVPQLPFGMTGSSGTHYSPSTPFGITGFSPVGSPSSVSPFGNTGFPVGSSSTNPFGSLGNLPSFGSLGPLPSSPSTFSSQRFVSPPSPLSSPSGYPTGPYPPSSQDNVDQMVIPMIDPSTWRYGQLRTLGGPGANQVAAFPPDLASATRAFISPGAYYPTFQGNPFAPPTFFGPQPSNGNGMPSPPGLQIQYSSPQLSGYPSPQLSGYPSPQQSGYSSPQQLGYFKLPPTNIQSASGFPGFSTGQLPSSSGSFSLGPSSSKKDHR